MWINQNKFSVWYAEMKPDETYGKIQSSNNFPLYYPNDSQEALTNAAEMHISIVKEHDPQIQIR